MSIFTIGHSNHPIDKFLGLLKSHGITAVADVRSVPYSKRNAQYDREALRKTLREHGIIYVFLVHDQETLSVKVRCSS